jgi:predicted metal-dependent HD superfamily phosphohydrolase
MILAIEHHIGPDDLPATQADDIAGFLDMDMAILGAEPASYDEYPVGVAREYIPVVGEAAYRYGRVAFLREALDPARPPFFRARARSSLDGPARSNMRRELVSLC